MNSLDELKISMMATPPTSQQIEAWREEGEKEGRRAKTNARWFQLAALGLLVTVAVTTVWVGVAGGTGAGAVTATVTSSVAVTFVLLMFAKQENWVGVPREHSRFLSAATAYLSAEDTPDECVCYLAWCEQDSTLQHYQRQVAWQKRNPIMAEYEAAKTWIAEAETRRSESEMIERARAACDRLQAMDL